LSDFLGNFWIGRLLATAQNIQKKGPLRRPKLGPW